MEKFWILPFLLPIPPLFSPAAKVPGGLINNGTPMNKSAKQEEQGGDTAAVSLSVVFGREGKEK